MSISIRQTGFVNIVDVSGRITLGDGAGQLRDALKQMITAGQNNILLNVADVTYLDSSGLGALVSSFATVTGVGGQLKLLNVPDRVKNLLVITKLYTVFEVFDDQTTAVHSFAAAPTAA